MFNTPGPWAADGELRQSKTGKHKCIWQINKDGSLAHTEPIATVWYYLHPGDANARLIAAAPEMLEALEQIAKGEGRFSRDQLTHCQNTLEDMKAVARAAIAKAEGRYEVGKEQEE